MFDPSIVLACVEACFKYGSILVEACATWKHADDEIHERVVRVEDCWTRTRLQFDFLVRIQSTLDSEHRRITVQNLHQLTERLSRAVSKIEGVRKKETALAAGFLALAIGGARRAKYVLVKSTLDGIIGDLEAWQRRFDPSWFLIIRVASALVDRELAQAESMTPTVGWVAAAPSSSSARARGKSPLALASGVRGALRPGSHPSVFLPEEQLVTMAIPFSNVRAGRRAKPSPEDNWFIIDSIACPPGADLLPLKNDIRELATKLASADPSTFGLLACKGVMPATARIGASPHIASLDLIFRAPERLEVLQSLRHMLLNSDANVSLSRKLRVAKELARSVGYVHTFRFVHKNVRPESVLVFEDTAVPPRCRTYLVGFDSFRTADGGTRLLGDLAWDRNAYRHPSRQGEHPGHAYRMQHDIYSLGVCLLELGLWESFVAYTEDTRPQPQFGESYSQFQAWLRARGDLPDDSVAGAALLDALGFRLKEYLVERARGELPPRMGDKYTQVVMSCLTCLDEDNDDFEGGEEEEEEEVAKADGMAVAVRFIEKILMQLDEISM